MKFYDDADLKVVKKSNYDALQVQRLRSSTHVRCTDVSRALVQQIGGSRRSGMVSHQHDGVVWRESLSPTHVPNLGTHVRERRGRENLGGE
jgi:hypothetical protein